MEMFEFMNTDAETVKEGLNVLPMSRMAARTLNPIRRMVDQMRIDPNPDKPMIPLSIGDPTIFGNLCCDNEHVTEAIVTAVRSGKHNGYAPANGTLEARTAVAEYSSCPNYRMTPNDVIITSGCSSALEHCILVLADPGHNILIPRPGFPLYITLAESSGIKCKYYNLLPEKQWEVDIKHLRETIDADTRAILVNNPSNPCGSVYGKEHLIEILKVAEEFKLPVIADEIYSFFTFGDTEFIFMASLNKNVPVLSCNGLTKRFICPGWRLGWIVIYDETGKFKNIRQGLGDLATRILGANTIVQGALPTILTKVSTQYFESILSIFKENLKIVEKFLTSSPGIKLIKPSGAMYACIQVCLDHFPKFKANDEFLSGLVQEESVFCLPTEPFGMPNYFRILLTLPADKMREACERIHSFCVRHYSVKPSIAKDSK